MDFPHGGSLYEDGSDNDLNKLKCMEPKMTIWQPRRKKKWHEKVFIVFKCVIHD